MFPPLKFVNDIIRPWENLNQLLVIQNSIDHSLSEIITTAEDLSIKLSHFPEAVGQSSLRTNKSSIAFNIVVDIADASKHDKLSDVNRNNNLTISSIFEGNEEGLFRFIRNKINIDHSRYGKSDFLEVFKKAVNFIITKLQLGLFWDPDILDAPNLFTDKVFLSIHYQHQVTWTGLKIEFVKKNEHGELVHFDPPEWLFELRSYHGIKANNYPEFIYQLLRNSIDSGIVINANSNLPINNTSDKYLADFTLGSTSSSNSEIAIVKILESKCSIEDIKYFHQLLLKTSAKSVILISEIEYSNSVKELVCKSFENIYLIKVCLNEAMNAPLRFFEIKYQHSHISMTSLLDPAIGVTQDKQHLFAELSGIPLNDLGERFSLDKKSLLNFRSLCLAHVKQKDQKTSGHVKLSYKPRDKHDIFIKIGEDFIKIGLEVEFDWASKNLELRMPILTFDKDHTGVSIWKLETYIESESGSVPLSFRVLKYGDTSAIGMI